MDVPIILDFKLYSFKTFPWVFLTSYVNVQLEMNRIHNLTKSIYLIYSFYFIVFNAIAELFVIVSLMRLFLIYVTSVIYHIIHFIVH